MSDIRWGGLTYHIFGANLMGQFCRNRARLTPIGKLKELQIEDPVMAPQDPPRIFKGPVFTPPQQFRCNLVQNGRKMVEKRGPFFSPAFGWIKGPVLGGSLAKSGIKGPVDPRPPHAF